MKLDEFMTCDACLSDCQRVIFGSGSTVVIFNCLKELFRRLISFFVILTVEFEVLYKFSLLFLVPKIW